MLHIHLTRWPFVQWRSSAPSALAVGWVALIISIIAGSSYNSFAKQLGEGLSPLSLIFVSEVLTGFFVLLSFGTVPLVRQILSLQQRHLLPMLVLGVINGIVAPVLWFIGLRSTSAVNAELFGRSEMLAMILFAVLFLGERIKREHIIAGAVMISGIIFVAFRGFSVSITLQWGDALILLASVVFASGSIIFKRFLHDVPVQVVTVLRSVVAVSAFFFVSPFITHPLVEEIRTFPLELLPALLGFAFIARFLLLISFYEAVDRIPVATVSLASTMNIVGGTLFAHFYLGEQFAWYHMFGGGLIALGVLLLQLIGVHATPEEHERHIRQHPRHHH
ncbi:MAG: DMT family transporter [Candidatus Peregrinibacteria bacterium]|nr:DMT family transporter [Candidatus Peregrinibacteria bacterium]